MDVLNALRGSLLLLKTTPKVFVPRLLTTALYTVYALYSMNLAADIYLHQSDPAYLSQNSGRVLLLFASVIVLYLIDIVSYAMYPKIVEDHSKGSEISLIKALSNALAAWPALLLLASILLVILFIVATATAVFEVMYLASGSWVYPLISLLFAICLLLAFAVLMFFFVPVAVTERMGVLKSLKKSFEMGMSYKKELFEVNILFAILMIATMILIGVFEFQGETPYLAMTAFIIFRLLQAIIYTYISVSNPYIYVALKNVNKASK